MSCTKGAIYDVVLDLRADSPTYLESAAAELTAENHRMLFIPEGCAHGFQTRADDTQLLYLMSEFYAPNTLGASGRAYAPLFPAFLRVFHGN